MQQLLGKTVTVTGFFELVSLQRTILSSLNVQDARNQFSVTVRSKISLLLLLNNVLDNLELEFFIFPIIYRVRLSLVHIFQV